MGLNPKFVMKLKPSKPTISQNSLLHHKNQLTLLLKRSVPYTTAVGRYDFSCLEETLEPVCRVIIKTNSNYLQLIYIFCIIFTTISPEIIISSSILPENILITFRIHRLAIIIHISLTIILQGFQFISPRFFTGKNCRVFRDIRP